MFNPVDAETNILFVASQTGNYAVVIEDNSCVDTFTCNSMAISSIEDTESLVKVIWPNPSTGEINVRVYSPLNLAAAM